MNQYIDVVVCTKTGREIRFRDVTGYNFSDGVVTVFVGGEPIGHVPKGSYEAVFKIVKDE